MPLYYLYLLSLPITLAICVYSYKRLAYNFKWYLPYFAFITIFEFVNCFNLLLIKHSNAWCNNIVGFAEFPILVWFIASFDKRTVYKKRVYIFTAAILFFSLIDLFFIQGFWERATIAIVLQALFILSLICIYYNNLLEDAPQGLYLLKDPPFLASTGWLFYFLAKIVFYICFNYMVYKKNYQFLILAGTIPGLSNLLLNLVLIYAFLCSTKIQRSAAI